MGSLIVVLTAVAIYCSETYCNSLTTAINKPEYAGLKGNSIRAIEKEPLLEDLNSSRRSSPKKEEPTSPDSTSGEVNSRKARLLGSLAFLAGLSFGGLATAASSTVKSVARMPPRAASITLNLGPSKGSSPYFAAYYSNPYTLLPYPFFYHGPLGFVPAIDPAKLQSTSSNDPMSQVINVFDQPSDLPESNVAYEVNEEKSVSDDGKDASGVDEVDYRAELRTEANRNSEEKVVILGCKQGQKKHSNSFRGSTRERENLRVDANELQATLKLQDVNTIGAGANQVVTANATAAMTTTTSAPNISTTTEDPSRIRNHTKYPHFPGYSGGYPQQIGDVDLTDSYAHHQYHGHSQINYNLPYERPASFYHDGNYDSYSNPLVNPHFTGSFPSDQINEYASTDYNRAYASEYRSPYSSGFTPVK